MKLQSKQEILNLIAEFNNHDFNKIYATKFPDEPINSTIVSDLTVNELISLAKRNVKILEERLEGKNWQVLPLVANLGDYGTPQLNQTISSITSYLVSANYASAVTPIKSLACYIMVHGLAKVSKDHDFDANFRELQNQTDALFKQLEEKSKAIDIKIEELNNKQTEINTYVNTKRNELEEISQNQIKSENKYNSIVSLEGSSQSELGEIKDLHKKCTALFDELSEIQKTSKKQQDEIKQNTDFATDQISLIDEGIEKTKKEVDETLTEIRDHRQKVIDMMGDIAASSLSHSFHKRKNQIWIMCGVWIVLSVIAVIGVVWVLYTLFDTKSANEVISSTNETISAALVDYVLRGFKIIPLACFLVFTIKQYNKERNIQEEYAFREAVALTLEAFIKQTEGDNVNENKKKILLDTIDKLYSNPMDKIPDKETTLSDVSGILKELKGVLSALKQ